MTRENYAENTTERNTVGPIYVVDISRENRFLALMISPGHGVLAPESLKEMALELTDSVRLGLLGA